MHRNSILMACHYPDLGSASDWSKQISLAAPPMRSSVLRLHFAGKPVVALFSQAGDKHILTVLDVEK